MKPTIGRIVHFVRGGNHYAAIVVRAWTDTCVNLVVFVDGATAFAAVGNNELVTSVIYSETPMESSWHWPEREGE